MADSWQNFLYKELGAFPVRSFTSESSVQLLDVLVKTKDSNPILYNVGSMVTVGSNESQITAKLREVLQHLESNENHDLIQRDTSGTTIRHTVKSRASLQSSFRIFGDDAKLDVDGDKDLECKLERLQVTTVNREKLMEYIRRGAWKPDVDKLKELKHWPEPSRRIPIFFGESKQQDLWVIYEILKAKKLSLASVDSHSGAVGADAPALSPVGGPPVGGNLSVSRTKKIEFEFTVPNRKVKAFAFRAIHAQYDSTGKFIGIVHNEGGPMEVRGSDDDEIDDDEIARLDLEGLFLKSPCDNEDLECLEIVSR